MSKSVEFENEMIIRHLITYFQHRAQIQTLMATGVFKYVTCETQLTMANPVFESVSQMLLSYMCGNMFAVPVAFSIHRH